MQRKLPLLLILCFIMGVFLAFPAPSEAYSTYYFYPSRTHLKVGETKEIQLRLNTDNDAVNAHSAYISYSSEYLDMQLKSLSNVFGITAAQTFSPGFIELSQGNIDPVKGDVLIATLTLVGKKEGEGAVTFTQGSAVPKASDNSDTLSLSRSLGGYYTVKRGTYPLPTSSQAQIKQETPVTKPQPTPQKKPFLWFFGF